MRPPTLARLVLGSLAVAAISLVLAFVIIAPFLHWALEPRMLEFIVPALLEPGTGYLPLAVVVFLVLWSPLYLAPAVLYADAPWAARAARRREDAAGTRDDGGSGTVEAPPDLPDADPRARCEIPLDPMDLLDARRRHQMARALDIPWDGRLARDDAAWEQACAAGLRRAAARSRGDAG